jgi:hydrogenase nickel incorporation protein HypB
MFRTCDAAILNKIDLLPHLDYDKDQAIAYIRQVNPAMPVFEISARTGAGMDGWIEWLKAKVSSKLNARR